MTELKPSSQQYDCIARNYYLEDLGNPFVHGLIKPSVFRILGDVKGLEILDAACGYGLYTNSAKQKGAKRALGFDYSEEMLAIAKEIERAHPTGAEYIFGDARNLGLLGKFDLVTAVFLFHYAEGRQDLVKMAKSIYDNLKVGGRLVSVQDVFVPTEEFNFSFPTHQISQIGKIKGGIKARVIRGRNTADHSFDIFVFPREVYESVLKEVGFKKILWHKPYPSEEAVREYGPEPFEMFKRDPVMLLEARK